MEPDTDGAFVFTSNNFPANFMIASEAFLKLLTADERAQFDVRQVEFESKRRKRFFEIIPKIYVPTVVIRELEVSGWRCDACGGRFYTHGHVLGWGVDVVCRPDLPKAPC